MNVNNMLVFYFIFFTTVKSFLLNNQQSNGGQTLPANQYMTLSKFYEEEKRLQQKMENLQLDTFTLRHDMDNSFVLLTAQLQEKLELLDTKLSDIVKINETNQDVLKIVEKYKGLELNYNNLKNENTILQNKYNQVETELQLVTNKTKQLDKLLLVQTGLYNVVLIKLSIQGRESAVLRNESVLVSQEISNLKQLGSIQPLQEIKTLQQKVLTISAQTNSLSMNERARSQDFLALHNMTTSSLTDLKVRTQRNIKQLENDYITSVRTIDHRVDNLINETRESQNYVGIKLSYIHKNQIDFAMNLEVTENRNNLTFSYLHDIEKKKEETENRNNLTFSHLQKQINDSTELVTMTAHLTTSASVAGILKFDDVSFSIGINNLASYKSTGKFVCERKGIYLISSSIMSTSNYGFYYIYLNGRQITNTMTGFNSNSPPTVHQTGTIVVALQLRPNDSVWLYNTGSYTMKGGLWSTLTIVKVK